MDVTSPANQDSFDAILADFLDWVDGRDPPVSTFSSSESASRAAVGEFLAQYPRKGANSTISEQLLEFIRGGDSVEKMFTAMTLNWIHAEHLVDGPAADLANAELPRDFGSYELLERIGSGGMGVVYRARQHSLDRLVCIKMLPPGLIEPERIRRLADEASLAGGLQHPGIVAVFDAGELEGQPFYVMEYIAGETLAQRISRLPFDSTETVRLLDAIAEAVEHAHGQGILHCDLKPSNVILDREERPRVADFGLARRLDHVRSTTGVAGTPSYMAPEQAKGERVDERTDVYGVGAILYELLTGRPPHLGETSLETLRLVVSEEPLPPGRLRAGLPRDLEVICSKCLEKQPAARYASLGAVREDLGRFSRHEPILAQPAGRVTRITRWMRRHPATSTAFAVGSLSLGLLLLVGTVALVQTRAALTRTRVAEQEQRLLASQLDQARQQTEKLLYRSEIDRAAQALDLPDVATARDILQSIATNPALTVHRGLEWDLLHYRAWPEIISLNADVGRILSFGWTANGRRLVTLDTTGTLAVWDPSGNKSASVLLPNHPTLLATHPHRPLLVTADLNGQIQFWEAEKLQRLSKIDIGPETARRLRWHPQEDAVFALFSNDTLRRIDSVSGAVDQFALSTDQISDFELSADGRWLAAVQAEHDIAFFETAEILQLAASENQRETDREVGQHRGDLKRTGDLDPIVVMSLPGWITNLAWSPDDPLLAATDDAGNLVFWRCASSESSASPRVEETWRTANGGRNSSSLTWWGNQLLIADESGWLSAFDTLRNRRLWRHPVVPFDQLETSSPNGPWAGVGTDGKLKLWDAAKLGVGEPLADTGVPIRTVSGNRSGSRIAWRNVDGEIVTGRILPFVEESRIVESALGATALDWSPVDDRLAVSRGSEVLVYQMPEAGEGLRLNQHTADVWTVKFSPDGKCLASGGSDGMAAVVWPDGSKPDLQLKNHHGDVRVIAFSPDGKLLATADNDATVRVWRTDDGELLLQLRLQTAVINDLLFADSKTLIIGDNVGNIRLLSLESGKEIQQWTAHQGPLWSLALMQGRIISAGQDGMIRVWRGDGAPLLRLAQLPEAVWSLDCNAHKRQLTASTTAGRIHVWRW